MEDWFSSLDNISRQVGMFGQANTSFLTKPCPHLLWQQLYRIPKSSLSTGLDPLREMEDWFSSLDNISRHVGMFHQANTDLTRVQPLWQQLYHCIIYLGPCGLQVWTQQEKWRTGSALWTTCLAKWVCSAKPTPHPSPAKAHPAALGTMTGPLGLAPVAGVPLHLPALEAQLD